MSHGIIYILYTDEDHSFASLVSIIRFLFHFYPPFLFSKCYTDISRISSNHFDSQTLKWLPGRDFEISDIFLRQIGTLGIGVKYNVDSYFYTCSWFMFLILVYISFITILELNAGIKGGSILNYKNLFKVFRETFKNFNVKKMNVKKQTIENNIIKFYEKFLKTEDNDPESFLKTDGIFFII